MKTKPKKCYAIFSDYEDKWKCGPYNSIKEINRNLKSDLIEISPNDNGLVLYELKPIQNIKFTSTTQIQKYRNDKDFIFCNKVEIISK